MHVPDGFLTGTASIGTAVVSAAVVAVAVRRSRDELDDRTAPLAGLVATFVFAAQMINFPVGAGTSGHLLGGALAAVLVGPWVATLVLTVVLAIQALLFADGGLTALGTNVLLMGVVGVWAGWFAFRGVRRLLPVAVASGLAGFVSVLAAALTFVGLYAVGGAVPVPFGTLARVMLSWHVLIAVGEAVITAAVVGAVMRSRPDLIRGNLERGSEVSGRVEVAA